MVECLDQEQLACSFVHFVCRSVHVHLSAHVNQSGPPELSHQGGISWKAEHKSLKHGDSVFD